MIKHVFYKTVHHFFPEFRSWLKGVKDPRQENSCDYQIQTLLWVGILVFVLKLGSRRKIDVKFVSAQFVKHLTLLTGQELTKCLHNSTLAYLLRMLNPSALYELRYQIINRLIRNKCFTKYRLGRYYMMTLDMTGYLTFRKRHCSWCLIKKVKVGKGKKKKVIYSHPVVEAKLVTNNGFALSIESEFVENREPGQKKQDCELKAAYRLLERLAERFPQLRICLVLDSLYVSEEILEICEKYDWRYIIVFKKGSAPELYQEYEVLKKRCTENYLAYDWKKRGEKQFYHWVTDIDYKFAGHHYVNILECLVRKKKPKKRERKRTRWLWLTNLPINKNNCMILANEGGRLRWKTENEGFNMQKNGGYNMEHPYIEDYNGAKCFYLLMQIAHILNQLLEKGSLLTDTIKKSLGSIREIAERLLEELRTSFFAPGEIDELLATRIQIRFDTS
jgi:hypothetical protein